jgi:hypothetical protein
MYRENVSRLFSGFVETDGVRELSLQVCMTVLTAVAAFSEIIQVSCAICNDDPFGDPVTSRPPTLMEVAMRTALWGTPAIVVVVVADWIVRRRKSRGQFGHRSVRMAGIMENNKRLAKLSGVGHYPDSKPLTESQRRKLCELMYLAFCNIRFTTWKPSVEALQRIGDLADAFHNLPNLMWEDDFSLSEFRRTVQRCVDKHPNQWVVDYLAKIDEIIAMHD